MTVPELVVLDVNESLSDLEPLRSVGAPARLLDTSCRYASEQCGVPLQRCASVAVHPWDMHGASSVGMCGWVDPEGPPSPGTFQRPGASGTTLSDVARGLVEP